MELSAVHQQVLELLSTLDDFVRIGELAARLERDQSPVMAACAELSSGEFVTMHERAFDEISLDEIGERFVDAPLPEREVFSVLSNAGGRCALREIPEHCTLDAGQVGQTIRWLGQKKLAGKEGGDLVLLDGAADRIAMPQPDERLLAALRDGRTARADELRGEGIDVDAALKLLSKRKGFITIKSRTDRSVSITDAGRDLLKSAAPAKASVTQLTPEMLSDGSWRNVNLRPYDVTLAAKKLYPGKEHAFQRTLDKVRRVFLEMGFTEIVSPWIESSFWDFDALFQPQDHPARDMQDTFYISKPDRARLPDDALVDRVRATHEDGGESGSTGWRYRWQRERAHKPVLRTHTTAATIRALWRHTQGTPGKYFVIGPVFRRETVDFKHLPVFHQVDGIIVDEHASLATLLGTLGAFYAKMGFPKVQFRPSFFPYTEPSAEVHALLPARDEFVEMGGSGIFRPEVTRPLGITDRVLAWGLGLERLAMLIHNLDAIGDLYFATMPWLREEPLCKT